MNKLTIIGNLTRDPELRTSASGTVVATFSVAVHSSEKNAAGEWTDRADFVDCVAFGSQAERFGKVARKGTKVYVSGKFRTSTWEAKDGSGKRSKNELVAQVVEAVARIEETRMEPEPAAAYYEEEIPF